MTNACGSDTLTQSLTVTGLASSFANGSVQVYPNPNTGTFRLSFDIGIAEEVVLSVQNLTGQVIFTQNLGIVDGRFERQFTLGGLSAGMYMLRLQSATGQSVHRMRVDK